MKTTFKLILFIFIFLSIGCTRHIKPLKFDVYPEKILNFKSDAPIRVLVPEEAEKEYLIEHVDPEKKLTGKIYVDLNDLYRIAKELIEKELTGHQVPLSSDAKKYLKFTITKAQWEIWAAGFLMGAYLDFDIETGDGYKQHYKVQDGSGWDINRSVGGTVTRAVEKIFQDNKVLAYIEKQ